MLKSNFKSISQLGKLLTILEAHNVSEYQDGTLKIVIKPKQPILPTKDISAPKNRKTEEQEAEDLLYHSSGR